MKQPAAVGDIVKASYKSGEYIGEVIEINRPRAVVKMLAVLKHPTQGDLHNPYEAEVPIFHQRRALAYTEKAQCLLNTLEPYEAESAIPDYKQSLKQALAAEKELLSRMEPSRWTELALQSLEELESDYGLN